jgi:hypothetical protein
MQEIINQVPDLRRSSSGRQSGLRGGETESVQVGGLASVPNPCPETALRIIGVRMDHGPGGKVGEMPDCVLLMIVCAQAIPAQHALQHLGRPSCDVGSACAGAGDVVAN